MSSRFFKILLSTFVVATISFANTSNTEKEEYMEANVCDKNYNECMTVCDTKQSENEREECYNICDVNYDKCVQTKLSNPSEN